MKRIKQIGLLAVLFAWFSTGEVLAQPYAGGSGDGFAQVEIQLFSTPIHVSKQKLAFQIYPNPLKQGSMVHVNLGREMTGTLELHTMAGRIICSIAIENVSEYDLPMSNFKVSAGIYALHLKTQQGTWIRKLVVQ